MAIRQSHRDVGVAVDHESREKDDWYKTPPEAVEALLSAVSFSGPIWEPAAGDGAISKALTTLGHEVVSTDLVDRGFGQPRVDFLMEYQALAPNIVTNPPFKLVDEFMKHSVRLAERKVALLARIACLEGVNRRKIYESTPLARVLIFSSRVLMVRGNYEGPLLKRGGMVGFAWYVWDKEHQGPPTLGWL